MLQLIFLLIFTLILASLVLGFLLPDKVHFSRDIVIDAPADKVFGFISDFNEWSKWSPWYKMDPDAEYEISGSGIGHKMSWTSTQQNVGTGSQEIIEVDNPKKMVTRLEFGDMGRARASFTIEPMGQSSKVTWALDTNMREGVPVLRQPMATFMGFFMEKWMDKPYTEGLADLKKLVEEN